MTLNVQNDAGTVTDANGYVTVADFKDYHNGRGNSYGTASDDLIEKAIIKATDYIDTRFRFRGVRSHQQNAQPTAWPRLDVVDNEDQWVSGVPNAVKRACCEYALRALSASLNPDPVKIDDTGLAVRRVGKRAGPVGKDVEYESGLVIQLPQYPAADNILRMAGLLSSGNELARA